MKILFLPKLLPRSDVIGGPILIFHRIKNLSRSGHTITLIAPAFDTLDQEDKSLQPHCEKVIMVKGPSPRSKEEVLELQVRFKRPRYFLRGYSQGIQDALNHEITKTHYDVLIAEYSVMGQYFHDNQHIPDDTATIVSCHECYTKAALMRAEKAEGKQKEEEIFDARELERYEFKVYNAADRIITLTSQDRDVILSFGPYLREKIDIVPHGVDTSFYHLSPKERSQETKRIMFLGNYQHAPNIDAVYNFVNNCWNRIKETFPGAEFHIVGFHPPKDFYNLGEGIFPREGGADVRKFYWNCDVFVAPLELGGGFRGKILEALSCGIPVVSTRLGIEGISPLPDEILVADDYKTFSDHVIRLLSDKDLRDRIVANGLKLAGKFDHINAAKRLDEILRKLVKVA